MHVHNLIRARVAPCHSPEPVAALRSAHSWAAVGQSLLIVVEPDLPEWPFGSGRLGATSIAGTLVYYFFHLTFLRFNIDLNIFTELLSSLLLAVHTMMLLGTLSFIRTL